MDHTFKKKTYQTFPQRKNKHVPSISNNYCTGSFFANPSPPRPEVADTCPQIHWPWRDLIHQPYLNVCCFPLQLVNILRTPRLWGGFSRTTNWYTCWTRYFGPPTRFFCSWSWACPGGSTLKYPGHFTVRSTAFIAIYNCSNCLFRKTDGVPELLRHGCGDLHQFHSHSSWEFSCKSSSNIISSMINPI